MIDVTTALFRAHAPVAVAKFKFSGNFHFFSPGTFFLERVLGLLVASKTVASKTVASKTVASKTNRRCEAGLVPALAPGKFQIND